MKILLCLCMWLLLREASAVTNSCQAHGFDGCCDPNTHITCHGDGTNEDCFCDQVCFTFNDCCDDINAIGCFANVSSPTAVSPLNGSCTLAGYQACCDIANEANCYGSPPNCYCDQACYDFNDCCNDIASFCDAPDNPTTDTGSCAALGYTQCCDPDPANNITCKGNDNECYCDEICYNYGDCCEDIEEINCLKDEESSCKQAGFVGCCNPDDPPCYSQTGKNTCYCDEICFEYGDCCNDIADIGCIAPTTTPTSAGDGSCINAGHTTCCTTSIFNLCLGDNGLCHCNAECYEVGDCCTDIDQLGCTTPTPTLAEGSCATAGFTTCCPNDNPGGCLGEPATCYCDALCYGFGDCCSDVASIGCIKPSVTPVENGSCLAAGYSGCCDSSGGASCKGVPDNCYCDAACHNYGDCCYDAITVGCTPPTGSCINAGRKECCPGDNDSCVGTEANCYCDQACFDKGTCCDDIDKLSKCQASIPGKVSNLMAIPASDTSLSVSWTAPTGDNAISMYTVSIQKYYGGRSNVSFADSATAKEITGLSPYQPYNVSVYAGNFKGNGEGSTVVNFTKEGAPLVAVTGVSAKRLSSDSSKLVVSWTPLSLTQARGFITEYTVTYNTVASRRRRTSDTIIHVDKDKSSVIIPVSKSKMYEVSVTCYTSLGAGPSSNKIKEPKTTVAPVSSNVSASLIVGVVLGGVGLLVLVIIITLVIVLVVYKIRGSKDSTTGRRYQKLFINADYEDDNED